MKTESGYNLLLFAIHKNNARIVEILLKNFNANPNVVDNRNCTALMYFALYGRGNLSIMKLLTKYGFDYEKLVNKRESTNGYTVFHCLCMEKYTDNQIECIKYLFQVCNSINILAKNCAQMCGLHLAIKESNVPLIKYLIENVYFPNNDKLNPDGIAFLNMLCLGNAPLVTFVLSISHDTNVNATDQLQIFKLLVSYGMNVNPANGVYSNSTLEIAIDWNMTEIVQFILNHNLCPIYTLQEIIRLMYIAYQKTPNDEILRALYNYGINYNLIFKFEHVQIISFAACINLAAFKTALSMVLEHHEINNLKQYNECIVTDEKILRQIAEKSDTKQDVKSFIYGLVNGDESKVSQMDTTTSAQITLTCINNHEIKDSQSNKMINFQQACPICNDNIDCSESLSGFQCDECKSFICHDCVIVQTISKKIDMIGAQSINSVDHERSIVEEVLQYKDNKKLMHKAK